MDNCKREIARLYTEIHAQREASYIDVEFRYGMSFDEAAANVPGDEDFKRLAVLMLQAGLGEFHDWCQAFVR